MRRTIHVAIREYVTTVASKGFVFGVVFVPLIIIIAIFATKAIMGSGPSLAGTILVIDQSSGEIVAPLIESKFSKESQEASSAANAAAIKKLASDKLKELNLGEDAAKALQSPAIEAAMKDALAGPQLTVLRLAADSNVESAKLTLRLAELGASGLENGMGSDIAAKPIALLVIPSSAISPDGAGDYSTFSLFTIPKLDFQIQAEINAAAGQSVVDARIASSDLKNDADRIRKMLARPRAEVKSVTAKGETKSMGDAAMLMPMAFMFLLWISIFTAGQYLLTTTIEEKSSRVMEILLSAVSPMQLMTGKIIGQMGVGLTLLLIYAGLGVGSLAVLNFMHLLDYTSLALLIVFFLIAFLLIAAMMAAVGSAVQDLREAQSLMTPIMLILMVPLMLWMPISRNPNGMFATICSMLPPISPFVMVIRIPAAAGTVPVPVWQIALSIGIGILSVLVTVWAASKIFRVGVLMYGKPPNFRTLVKWLRMA